MDKFRSARARACFSVLFRRLSLVAVATLGISNAARAQGFSFNSVAVSPTSLTFAEQKTGTTSAAQTVTLTNTGFFPAFFNSATVTGANASDFTATSNCQQLLFDGMSCSRECHVQAQCRGHTDCIVIDCGWLLRFDADGQSVGQGSCSHLHNRAEPDLFKLRYAEYRNGQRSAEYCCHQHRQPAGNNKVDRARWAKSRRFVSTNNCPATLAVSAKCSVSVTFKPTAPGVRTASLAISDDATGSPQEVGLSGTGFMPVMTISVSPNALTFASQTVATSSAAQIVTLKNTGNLPVTITSIALWGTNAGDFAQTNNCPASLAVSGNCSINVTFKPTAVGARSAAVSITDSATGSPQAVILAGTGKAAATNTISVSPTALTFGTQNTGTTSAAQTVAITNTGNQAVTITSISVAGANASDFAETNTCPASLAVSGTCSISVTFKPTAAGTRTGSISITDTATGSPQSVSLTGTGQTVTNTITVTPTALTFATQNTGSTSAAKTLAITNTGNQAVTINSITVAGTNSGDFAQTNNCPASLATSGTCSISVTFKPTAAGTRMASISIADTATGSPQTVSLMGTGQVATTTLTVNPTALLFATQNTGTTSAAQTVAITNTGNQAVTISSIAVGGTNAADFAQTNNCPASLAISGTCTINVTFSPTNAGTRTAALTITDSASGSPQSVTLSGTGQVTATSISVSPSSLTFATQNTGTTSASQTVAIKNTGNQAITISSVALGGTNAGDFAETNNCPASLAVSGRCSISVTFKPTAAGTRAAALTITDTATGSPQSVTLSGTGQVATTTISLSPTALTFATQNTGTTSAAQSVLVTNTGNQAVTITSISLGGTNGTDFAQTNNCPSSLAVSGTCSISVTFSPTAAGTRAAAITIADNATGSPQSVTLTGTGQVTATSISVSPTSLTFAAQNTGTASGAQSVTISNTGNQPVTISSIALGGTNAGDFAETNNCGASLAVSGTCSISVTFKPTATGARTGSIAITDNATGSPQTISLSGTGQTSTTTLTLNPTSLTFSAQNVSSTSSAQTIQLTNTGTVALSISSVAVTGTNANDFSISGNTCGTSVSVGGTCAISVVFVPTATGTRTAALAFTDNATGSPQSVSLTGTGQASSYTVSVSPTSLTYATQNVGSTSGTQTATIANTGKATITISSIAIGGTNASDFAIATNHCGGSAGATLSSGSSCGVDIAFTPKAAGTRTATLTFTDNATGSPQTVSLTGTGQTSTYSVSVSPTSLTYATQNVGSTSGTQTATIANTGNATITISSITIGGTSASDFAIATNHCGGSAGATLSSGSTCGIDIAFTPTATGTRTATLTFTDNATASSTQTVTLTGTGQASTYTVSVTPASLTYATQAVGSTSTTQTATIANTGNATITISSIALGGTNPGDFTIATNHCGGSSGASLSPGSACGIDIAFTPKAAGSRTATLTFTDNATTGSPQTVTLTGTGQTQTYTVSLSSNSLTYGAQNLGTTSSPQGVFLNNTGNSPVTVSTVTLGGANAGDFAIYAPYTNCTHGYMINPSGGSCEVGITFTPTAAGTRTATLTFADNATGSPQTVTLTGTGQNQTFIVSLSTNSLTYSAQNVGTTSSPQQLSLTNTGTAAVTLSTVVLGGANAGDFAIYAPYTNCTNGLVIQSGSSCVIGIAFSPTVAGARTATLTFTDNATAGATQTVSLTGTGQTPTRIVSVSTNSLTYSAQNVGTTSGAQQVTLSNTGNAPVTLSTVALSGTNAGDFALVANYTNCSNGLVIQSGGSCVIGIAFSPTVAGTRTATLTFTDNATAGSTQTVSLSGTGQTPTYSVSLSTASLTYGAQNVGSTSGAQQVTLNNSGNAPVTLSTVALGGTNVGDFVISASYTNCSNGLVIQSGSSCIIGITFSPTATGTRTATLTFTDNAMAGSTQTVSLTGTGQTAGYSITVSPGSLTFSTQNVNTTSSAQQVTITNTGNAAVTFSAIATTGANAGDFQVSNGCGTSVAAGGTCYVSVSFAPTATGARSASLRLTDNATGSPQSVSLSGTGGAVNTGILSFSPTSLTFAPTTISYSAGAQVVSITNTGTGTVTLSNVTLTGANPGDFAFYGYNSCASSYNNSLPAGQSCYVQVNFVPTAVGTRTAAVTLPAISRARRNRCL